MLILLGGLNAATGHILKLYMMKLLGTRTIAPARKVEEYVDTLPTFGRQKFMLSIIDHRSQSSLEFCQLDLDRRRAELRTTPRRFRLILTHYICGMRPPNCF